MHWADDSNHLFDRHIFLAGRRAIHLARERENFPAALGSSFGGQNGGAHVVDPDGVVFFLLIIVTRQAHSLKRFAHHFAAGF